MILGIYNKTMDAIITERQMELFVNFQIVEARKNEFQEKYDKLDDEQKQLFEEFSRIFIPNYNGVLTEQEWYNTLGDLVGFVDPTGIVDAVNGLSYIYQGNWFFGLLSLVSAIPLMDYFTKPFMLAGKGSRLVKVTNEALKLAKAGNVTKATEIVADVAKGDSLMAKFTAGIRKFAPKIKNFIDRVPMGRLGEGFKKTLKDWITMFEKVGSGTQKASKLGKGLEKYAMTRQLAKNPMTKEETIDVLKRMQKALKSDYRLFRDFGGSAAKGLKGFKNYKASGMGRLFGNKATRSLMRRTKFWAGFLDYLGVANFVGPDELAEKMPDMEEKVNQYAQTAEAKQNWDADFANVPTEPPANYSPEQPENNGSEESSFGKDLLSKLVFGPITGNVVA